MVYGKPISWQKVKVTSLGKMHPKLARAWELGFGGVGAVLLAKRSQDHDAHAHLGT